jgi:lysyl-tRNA synthetase class 2
MNETYSSEYRQQRLAHLQELQARGIAPFGAAFARSGTLVEVRARFEEGRRERVAGRLVRMRNMGKSVFADLHDGSDRLQLYLQRDAVGEAAFDCAGLLDLGDHVGVEGVLFRTRTGEPSLKVESWTLLAKALLPLPEKWHGLQDLDTRYRQRYLDLIANPEVRAFFNRRSRAIREIREFLTGRGFVEVETPMIQAHAGGAAAKPFATRYSALDQDMYLRIAPELYLKRLLVGGFDRVFELNRCFRNEGLDRTHNPEFTMLEIYEAYSDVNGMKALVQDLIARVATEVFGGLDAGTEERPIRLQPPWREVTYGELIAERMGRDWDAIPVAEARERAVQAGLDVPPEWDKLMIGHEVYEKLVERTLVQPTFVTRLPSALIPLARACPDDPASADVFELVIGGQEIAPAYTELNDPLAQRERLARQAGPDAERIDEDFLLALEHGMPPAGGMGVGIDRLLMVLSGQEAIRDVILFPQLKPKE